MWLNHPETIPSLHQSTEKLSIMKPVPDATKVEDCYSTEFTEPIKSITQSLVIITPC